MDASGQHGFLKGLVLSDLHLFSSRSAGEARLASIHCKLSEADLIVLNGDTFDFRWSVVGNEAATIEAALQWLKSFTGKHERAEIHFVLGNHDCLDAFTRRLDEVVAGYPRFHWHETVLRIGSHLFLHGDCAHRSMDVAGLDVYRQAWRQDRQRGRMGAHLYQLADRLGITFAAHAAHFPRARTVARLSAYLDNASPGWRDETRDCYFGHTHLPFEGHEVSGVRFHNTGSAIGSSPFMPVGFKVT